MQSPSSHTRTDDEAGISIGWLSEAAEQKYDWGGWRERLRSSRLSVRSVRMRRAKIGEAKAPLAAPVPLSLVALHNICLSHIDNHIG